MTTDRVWVLGASDPEMETIEKLLREVGEEYIYALDDKGARVNPGNAYRCPVPEVPEGAQVYAVECIDTIPEGWIRIDHHRPGDPGYGRPPEKFLPASSIGQVIAELARLVPLSWETIAGPSWPWEPGTFQLTTVHDRRRVWRSDPGVYDTSGAEWDWVVSWGANCWDLVPRDLVLAAAADHCLGAAYRGECPGVDPDALMRWRVETRAAHQGRSVEELLADVERAREALRDAPIVELSAPRACEYHGATYEPGCGACVHAVVRDLRGRSVPELPEAAAREGAAYLATVVDRDGRRKVVLGGHTTPEAVNAFMHGWASAQGLTGVYGDPARGFAGGYLP